jgi:hypothetical protein
MGWLSFIFGNGKNVIKETVEVFRPNAEAADQRSANQAHEAMAQFSDEFGKPGVLNGLADGLNRLGRPVITYGVIGLFISAMYDPLWFAARMQGLVLVPDQLWLIFGAIVSFFFGSRELSKLRSSGMAKEAARIIAAVPDVVSNLKALTALSVGVADTGNDTATRIAVITPSDNRALEDWVQNA